MSTREDAARLVKEAMGLMKSDIKGALASLERAHAAAIASGDAATIASVAEELSRGWARKKSPARSIRYAVRATKAAPERKAAWNTLANACRLVATRTRAAKTAARPRSTGQRRRRSRRPTLAKDGGGSWTVATPRAGLSATPQAVGARGSARWQNSKNARTGGRGSVR